MRPRTPRRLLALALGALLLLFISLHRHQSFRTTYFPFVRPTNLTYHDEQEIIPEYNSSEPNSSEDTRATAYSPPNSQMFYRLFTPLPATQADTAPPRVPAHDAVPDACLEAWLAQGVYDPCERLHTAESADQERIDFVWTWVNGSSVPIFPAVSLFMLIEL